MPAIGNRLELPKDEQFTNYAAVKKCLLTAGGKYVKCGFVFPDNAEEVKMRLIGGEAINDRKTYQFFPTPKDLAKHLVTLADVHFEHDALEPEAGQGAIAEELSIAVGRLVCVELMEQNCKVLRRKGFSVIEKDFLSLSPVDIGYFHRIVANPPFTKNQDIDHVKHMYDFLLPGGKLVSVMGPSWTFGSQKKQVAFREWLDEVGANVTEVPAGAFKESGTNVASVIVEITKQ
jgi:hypothetical protein